MGAPHNAQTNPRAVSERNNAFLNFRHALPTGHGTEAYFVNSVSLPIQEYADQIGKVRLLNALVHDGLDEDSSMRQKSLSSSTH